MNDRKARHSIQIQHLDSDSVFANTVHVYKFHLLTYLLRDQMKYIFVNYKQTQLPYGVRVNLTQAPTGKF